HRFESRASERLAGQRVFDDTHEHALGARLRTKIGHLRHRESTVFGSDHRKGGLRHFGHFGHQHFLVFEVKGHYPPSWTKVTSHSGTTSSRDGGARHLSTATFIQCSFDIATNAMPSKHCLSGTPSAQASRLRGPE